MTDQVQDALEKKLSPGWNYDLEPIDAALRLAPLVEKALRAAYMKGLWDGADGAHITQQESRGVRAGIAVLTEEWDA